MKKVTLVLTILIALLLVTNLPAHADTMINLNEFFADSTVTVAPDGSSALMGEDSSLLAVLLANDPGLGDPDEPEVIFAEIGGVPQILSFSFDFTEPLGNDDEFGAFVLYADTGLSIGTDFEFFTDTSGSGSVSFDLSTLTDFTLGLQFQLSALPGDGLFTSTVEISNVMLAPVPEPATMILLGTGLVGLLGFGRKKFRKTS